MSEDVFGNKFDEMNEGFEADESLERSGENLGKNEELNAKNSALEQDSAMQDRAKV